MIWPIVWPHKLNADSEPEHPNPGQQSQVVGSSLELWLTNTSTNTGDGPKYYQNGKHSDPVIIVTEMICDVNSCVNFEGVYEFRS
jgi:hypothetical protein